MAVAVLGFGGYKIGHSQGAKQESVADTNEADEAEEGDDAVETAKTDSHASHSDVKHEVEIKHDAEAKSAGHPSVHAKLAESEDSPPLTFSSFLALTTYRDAWHRISARVEEIRRLDDENETLRMENAHLRVSLESAKFESRTKDFMARTQSLGGKVSHEAGVATGRVLASIEYRPPTQLLPEQLYTLGISYLKAREDEKAAVILTLLTELEDNDDYKTAKNFVLTGLAWYRVDNLEIANHYFDRVLAMPAEVGILKYQAQARLWKGLVAYRQNDRPQSQKWLRELIERFPHSTEAQWINSKEGIREPASHE